MHTHSTLRTIRLISLPVSINVLMIIIAFLSLPLFCLVRFRSEREAALHHVYKTIRSALCDACWRLELRLPVFLWKCTGETRDSRRGISSTKLITKHSRKILTRYTGRTFTLLPLYETRLWIALAYK